MANKIFISYNFTDRVVTQTVKNMMQKLQQQIAGQLVQAETDVSHNGQTAIDWEIGQLMQECDAVLFVLADNPRISPWLAREVRYAIANKMPIIVTCLPDTQCEKPEFMDQVHCLTSNWHSEELSSNINRC
jgi:hypothetical protein